MGTFKNQLIVLMGAIVLLVLVSILGVMLWAARNHLFEVGATEAVSRAEAFALKAVYATYVGKGEEEGQQLLEKVVEAPHTLAAELVDASGLSLGVKELQPGTMAVCSAALRGRAVGRSFYQRMHETWCISVPVRASAADGSIAAGNLVGGLRIVATQTNVKHVVSRLFAWGLGAGVAILCVSGILLYRVARRVTQPLQSIADTMWAASRGDGSVRAELAGPQECVTIAKVYNELMDHQEAKVEERTRQLHAATEAARQAERYKSIFMRTIGHEMKTPLHVIDANARHVLSELELLEGSQEARKSLGVVFKETAELSTRVSQVLALAKAEAGSYQPVASQFLLQTLKEDIVEKAQPFATKHRNELNVTIEEAVIYTDRDVLLQIVSNLTTNACKFTSNGTVSAELRVDGDALVIQVTDNGCGIPLAVQPHVWEEFRQADMDEGRRFGGIGLGLAIVKRFTEALGGQVELQSEPGRGTRVSVKLPGTVVSSA